MENITDRDRTKIRIYEHGLHSVVHLLLLLPGEVGRVKWRVVLGAPLPCGGTGGVHWLDARVDGVAGRLDG